MPELEGTNGKFDYDIVQGPPDRIKIKFKPKRVVNGCKDIRLVQTVWIRALGADGKVVGRNWDDIYKNPNHPFKPLNGDTVVRKVGEDSFLERVDHKACEGDPYYNGSDPQDTASRGDATTNPPRDTDMSDRPSKGWGSKKDAVKVIETRFETCAVCAENGGILACFSWKSTATRSTGDRGDITVDSTTAADDATSSFKDAFKKFVKRHTADKRLADGTERLSWYCPQDGTKRGAVPKKVEDALIKPAKSPLEKARVPRKVGWLDRATPVPLTPGSSGTPLVYTSSAAQVVDLIVSRPRGAAIKFTWAGDQEKTVNSLVFATLSEVSPGPFEALALEDPRMQNDYARLLHVQASGVFCGNLAGRVAAADGDPDGPATVTLFGDIDRDEAVVHTVALDPAELDAVLSDAATEFAQTKIQVEILRYLDMTMGSGELRF